jgi:hypothetical protein
MKKTEHQQPTNTDSSSSLPPIKDWASAVRQSYGAGKREWHHDIKQLCG